MSDSGCESCASKSSCSPKEKQQCDADQGPDPRKEKLQANLSRIKHKIVVISGKGGVGKSTMSVNIAVGLAQAGKKVGLLDVDIHGPSVPRLLSLSDAEPHIEKEYMEPVPYNSNLWVISLGFMLPKKGDDAVIWRGPVKIGLIRQFLTDVTWGDLDYLVVDCPPGTGDEPLSVLQVLGKEAKAVIVTTPQAVAIDDVRRSVTFCRQLETPILGIVENMSGYVCRNCGQVEDIFASGGGQAMAESMGAPFLGKVPLDPEVVRSADEGYPIVKVHNDSPVGQAMQTILKPILDLD